MMKVSAAIVAILVLIVLALPAFAQPSAIPSNTVIPVSIDNELSSNSSHSGDRFTAHCSQTNCGGFLAGTTFGGQVTDVIPASGNTPAQLDVQFIQAVLPDGTIVPIDGSLTSLSATDVRLGSDGRLVGTTSARSQKNKFIAYGAGAGLVIGALSGGSVLRGTLLGAAAGYLYGALQGKSIGRDVDVKPGTEFGILLNRDVRLSNAAYYPPTNTDYGTIPAITTCATRSVSYSSIKPYYANNGVLMVPLQTVMQSVQLPYSYDSSRRTLRLSAGIGTVVNQIGSSRITVDGRARSLSAPTKIDHGSVYVPADFVKTTSGLTPVWNSSTQTLSIE